MGQIRIFEQLYIIMAWCKGVCLPAAFCLLGGKHRDTYMRMLYELQKGFTVELYPISNHSSKWEKKN